MSTIRPLYFDPRLTRRLVGSFLGLEQLFALYEPSSECLDGLTIDQRRELCAGRVRYGQFIQTTRTLRYLLGLDRAEVLVAGLPAAVVTYNIHLVIDWFEQAKLLLAATEGMTPFEQHQLGRACIRECFGGVRRALRALADIQPD